MKWLSFLFMAILLVGCDTESARIEREKFENNAIKSVQEAQSVAPGLSCIDLMRIAAIRSEQSGSHFKSKGWMAYKEPGHAVIIYQAEENGKLTEFKWHIEDGYVFPVNDAAKQTIKNQRAKYL